MSLTNDSKLENSKVFEALSYDSKIYEISMKKGIENKLMFHMILIKGSKKKI